MSLVEINRFIVQGSVNINQNILFFHSQSSAFKSFLSKCYSIDAFYFILFNICMFCLYIYSLLETTASIPSHLESARRTPYRGLRRQWLILQSYLFSKLIFYDSYNLLYLFLGLYGSFFEQCKPIIFSRWWTWKRYSTYTCKCWLCIMHRYYRLIRET